MGFSMVGIENKVAIEKYYKSVKDWMKGAKSWLIGMM